MKTAYLIMGPIGSGKSAMADLLFTDDNLKNIEYVASDIYKTNFFDSASDVDNKSYRCADELAFSRLEQICKLGRDFAYEFCPTNPNKLETIKYLLRKYSYCAISFFVCTESETINLERCESRERAGADGVSKDKIRSRYDQALGRALELTQLSKKIYFIDNSLELPRAIACISDCEISLFDDSCKWFDKHVKQKLVY